jgi:hypothetical protein
MYKALEVQAPHNLLLRHNYTTIFLAGSIEMGKAEDWQRKIIDSVPEEPIIFFNPRRNDWDSSWGQTKEDPRFVEQVQWELEALEVADQIVMYFDPKTMSPISLIEMGAHIRDPKLTVICPDGFWKKGNVDITCDFYNTRQVDSIDAYIAILKSGALRKRK